MYTSWKQSNVLYYHVYHTQSVLWWFSQDQSFLWFCKQQHKGLDLWSFLCYVSYSSADCCVISSWKYVYIDMGRREIKSGQEVPSDAHLDRVDISWVHSRMMMMSQVKILSCTPHFLDPYWEVLCNGKLKVCWTPSQNPISIVAKSKLERTSPMW